MMFSVQRHEEKSTAVSAVLPTKQNLTKTTIVVSRNTNYFERFTIDFYWSKRMYKEITHFDRA